MRIVRLANFVGPKTGGIRTALIKWGEEYVAAGHEPFLVIPTPGPYRQEESQGVVYRLPALPIGSTGYSLITQRHLVARLLESIKPDVIEVHDRTTMRWLGRWARRHHVPSIMLSHENMTGIMLRRTPAGGTLSHLTADFVNKKSMHDFDAIVTPSHFAAAEFEQLGCRVHVVPLGVDPGFRPPEHETGIAPDGTPKREGVLNLIHCGRLSPEKNPGLSIEALRWLVNHGHDAHLTVLGHGPMQAQLIEQAKNLPVVFHSYITDRAELGAVYGSADCAFAPGPVETFGLAALEALACGTPVVCPDEGALQETVGEIGGAAAPSRPEAFARAALEVMERPARRADARRQAEKFNWRDSARNMMAVHAAAAARQGQGTERR